MTPGSIVTGVVIDIDSDWVTVHAALKSEGVIPRSQFVAEGGEFASARTSKVKPLSEWFATIAEKAQAMAGQEDGKRSKLSMP